MPVATVSADFRFQRSRFTKIDVFGAAGNDTIRIEDINGVFTDTEGTRLVGEDGHDTINGSIGPETLSGGAGDDALHGSRGADVINGDAGNDTVSWNPGDGNDLVEGGTGTDRLAFNGSNAGETIDVVPAAGGRVSVIRNIALVVLDLGSTSGSTSRPSAARMPRASATSARPRSTLSRSTWAASATMPPRP